MSEESIKIGIVFVPSDEACNAAVKLSDKISRREEAFFVLDNINFLPHITIYSSGFPAENLERIIARTEKIARDFSPVRFGYNGNRIIHGYVMADTVRSKEMQNIHAAVVENISPLREIDPEDKNIYSVALELPARKIENIKKYGQVDILEFYKPHLTLTRLKDEKLAEKITEEINWPIKEFEMNSIGIYRMGKNGVCSEKIEEFKLG